MKPATALLGLAALAASLPAAAQTIVGVDDSRTLQGTNSRSTYEHAFDSCEWRPFACGESHVRSGSAQAALPWFRLAARSGSPRAMRAIGLVYLRGEGDVAQDLEQAMSWFYEAALNGDADSMLVLARAFERGLGVETDERLAGYWLRRAAENGSEQARRELNQGP